MDTIDLTKIEIKLHNGKIDLSKFSCDDNDLDEFLKEDSIRQKNFMLNSTYIATYKKEIIGFFTISTDNIPLKDLGKAYKKLFKEKDIRYEKLPALKIGRLGVKKDFQNKGIGKYLLRSIFSKSIDSWSENTGFRFITINSYPENHVINFYEKLKCKHIISQLEKEKRIKKYKKAIERKDYRTANKITIPLFRDLYQLKISHQQKGHDS